MTNSKVQRAGSPLDTDQDFLSFLIPETCRIGPGWACEYWGCAAVVAAASVMKTLGAQDGDVRSKELWGRWSTVEEEDQ